MPIPDIVRLSDARPACTAAFTLDAVPGAWLPDAMQTIARLQAQSGLPCDISARFQLAGSLRALHCGLSLHMRASDPYAALPELIAARRQLCDAMCGFFDSRGIGYSAAPDDSAPRLLPDVPHAFLRRKRSHSISETHLFASIRGDHSHDREAILHLLRRAPGSGIALILTPRELSAAEMRMLTLLRSGDASSAPAKAGVAYACAAYVWGPAARDIFRQLREDGLPADLTPPAPDPMLPFQLLHDPWSLHSRMDRSFGGALPALSANTLTQAELAHIFRR